VSVALPAASRARAEEASLGRLLDGLLAFNVFTITFLKLRWAAGGPDINISDIGASLFLLVFAADSVQRRDGRLPRTAVVLGGFFVAFLLVYLAGFFGVETIEERSLYAKGMVKFAIHFAFLVGAVVQLIRRPPGFYWRMLGWFVAGLVANAAYGLVQLAVAETTGGNLDQTVLSPIGAYQRGGINVFGVAAGSNIYRTNALTLDPNHLGIMLVVPLLVLLPIYLRLPRAHRLRVPIALVLVFLALIELSTLSRSGLAGLLAGLLVLALPYARLLLTARLLVPLLALAGVLAIVVALRTSFFETVFRVRTNFGGSSGRTHLEIYELLPPVISEHPLFGRGINTFSAYYEFITGRSNFGPHSYYVAVLSESGLVGAALFLVYLVYLFRRLGVTRRIGAALQRSPDAASRLVRPLGWGLTAALVGTLVSNAFYLTMQMYYFFVLAMFVVAAPAVFARRLRDGR
jgi:hypothetical protein